MHGYIEDTKVAILGESSDKRQYLVQGPGRFQKRRWIDKEFIRTEDVGVCGMCDKVITSADSTVKGEEVPELGGRLGSLAHLKCVAEAHADRAEAHQQYRFEMQGVPEDEVITFEEWLEEDDDPYEDENNDPAYLAYCQEMAEEYEERGELAGSPREMECHPCHLAGGGRPGVDVPKKKVVKLGPVAGAADPTQTYVLECGHTAF